MYGFSDGEETMEDEHYPQSLFVCDDMEVVVNVDEDGEVGVNMFGQERMWWLRMSGE